LQHSALPQGVLVRLSLSLVANAEWLFIYFDQFLYH
jgi:hypothetical protein